MNQETHPITKQDEVDMHTRGIVHSVTRGAWTAHVIDRNIQPRNHMVGRLGRYLVRLDAPDGHTISWPFRREDDSKIFYRFKAPRDAKRAAKACYRHINSLVKRLVD